MNQYGRKITNKSDDDIIGKKVTDIFPGLIKMGLFDVFKRVNNTGVSEELIDSIYKDDKISLWVYNYVYKLRSGEIVAIFDDITDKKRSEENKFKLENELRQAKKMEAIGTLTGGISHDFNNLLQAINGYTQLTLVDKTPEHPDYNNLLNVFKAGERAADLVKQLLLFSRKVHTEKNVINLNHEMEQGVKLLERIIPKMINIDMRLSGRLWKINADPLQIEQALLNLGSNAADAMSNGGKFIIETDNVSIGDDNYIANIKKGNYVLLTISDNGVGIPQEIINHIYDPFFTTKEIGKGTGLGLSSVYGIMKNHDGYINCYSEIGKGTTFRLYFPAIVEDKNVIENENEVNINLFFGDEIILIVDDEESIRDYTYQALTKFGYNVITASSGEEAIKIYSEKGKEIDLIILDLGMPGMGGLECLKVITKIDSDVKIIIDSGYSISKEIITILNNKNVKFINKPYTLFLLLEKIRESLK